MTTWNATQTRHLPVFAAALPMVEIQSSKPRSNQPGRDAERWRG